MSISASSPGRRWLAPGIALALGAVTLWVFWPARHFEFLNWDDLTYISRNDYVRGGLTWNGFVWSFTHSYSSNWHPLTWLSHMADCQLYGLNPGGHHLTNVLFHTANSVLLFVVLRRMTATGARTFLSAASSQRQSAPGSSRAALPVEASGGQECPRSTLWRSAFVAALFALHPLHVESVAWVAERKDMLSGFFFMLTLFAYARYAEVQSPKSNVQSPESKVLSLKSKVRSLKAEVRSPKPDAESSVRPAAPGSMFDVRCSMFDVRPSPRLWYWTAVGIFACGLMSKPMLVTLPFVLLLLDYWPLGRIAEWGMRSADSRLAPQSSLVNRKSQIVNPLLPLLLEKAPFFVLSAASCLITFLAQRAGGAVASFAMLPLDARIANAAIAYVQYLAKLFWPVHLSPIYPHPAHWGAWPVAGAAVVLVLLTAAAWRGRRRFPYALMGWLWFVGMLVPVIGLVQVGSQAYADRYTYLPLVGIMVAVVWLAAELFHIQVAADGSGRCLRLRKNAPTAVGGYTPSANHARCAISGLALVLLAALAWRTREQLPIWKDTPSLFGYALKLSPNNVQALYGLGACLVDAGRIDEGKRLLEEAIRLQPAYPEALGTLGNTLDGQGKYAEAIQFYQAALKAQPDQAGILNNLAWLLASCPDAAFRNGPEAVRLATRACDLTGYSQPLLIGTLAAAQAEAGDFRAAIATAERAASLATSLHLEDIAAKNRELIQLYRRGQPFHEKSG